MKTKPLTREEKAWLKAVEKLLMNPPTKRIGFYTTGDPHLSAYDRSREKEILENFDKMRDKSDFCIEVNKAKAGFGFVESACPIHSTAG